jgi:hypothetical protein
MQQASPWLTKRFLLFLFLLNYILTSLDSLSLFSSFALIAQIGQVLDTLGTLGLWNNTIVVFHGDHGYSLGEHGHWEKSTLFESGSTIFFLLTSNCNIPLSPPPHPPPPSSPPST